MTSVEIIFKKRNLIELECRIHWVCQMMGGPRKVFILVREWNEIFEPNGLWNLIKLSLGSA